MHRQTPLTAGYVGYTSGGARALVDTVNDDPMMQEMKGSFMQNEGRDRIESPQNYGFTSVVRPATKGKDGKIDQCAEAFISFVGGNRSFPIAGIMDDRRYRPMGLKPGENAQYDDVGQMTLMRRNGLYLLTNDNPEEQQQQQSGSGATPTPHAGSGSQTVERFVSMRHVEKKKQKRKLGTGGQSGGQSGGGATPAALDTGSGTGSGQSQQDFKHEGDTVNTEVRVTKKRIEFRVGDTVVGYYDVAGKKWCFIGEVHLGTEDAAHPVYGVKSGKGMTTEPNGAGAVLVNATKPGPPTSLDTAP